MSVIDQESAEWDFVNPGDRVTLNGKLVDAGFDIIARAGGRDIAIDRTYNANVTDGRLHVNIVRTRSPRKLSAIEIKPGATPVPVTVNPPATILPNTQTLQFSATVVGASGNPTVNWSVSPNIGTISATGLCTPPATFDPNITNVVITATTTTTPPVGSGGSGGGG